MIRVQNDDARLVIGAFIAWCGDIEQMPGRALIGKNAAAGRGRAMTGANRI
jgi:hypothetical protein